MRTWEEIGTKYRASYKPCPTCAGPMAKHAKFCQKCSPLIMRGENHVFWKGDAARDETKRNRAQKMYELGDCERCCAPAADRHHVDGDTGNNVRENIQLLCRRCHMEVDGRLARLVEMARRNSVPKPPKPCGECGKLSKPLSLGLCHTCYERQRRRAKAAA